MIPRQTRQLLSRAILKELMEWLSLHAKYASTDAMTTTSKLVAAALEKRRDEIIAEVTGSEDPK